MLHFLSLALVVVFAAAVAATGAPPATVTLTHYSDAQCPCSARIPQDVQEHFLDPEAGYERMVVFQQFFVGDLRKNVSKCIHGEAECVGQRHFACAQNMSIPSTPTATAWITFEACSYGKCTDCPAIEGKHCPCANYTSFPDFASNDQMETCAGAAGLDWAALHACGTGAEGQALMERSSTRSNEDGITYGVDGLAPMYVDGAKVKTKHLIPIVCGPTPDEVKPAVCKALAAKGAMPTACGAAATTAAAADTPGAGGDDATCPGMPAYYTSCKPFGGKATVCCDERYAEALRSMCAHPGTQREDSEDRFGLAINQPLIVMCDVACGGVHGVVW